MFELVVGLNKPPIWQASGAHPIHLSFCVFAFLNIQTVLNIFVLFWEKIEKYLKWLKEDSVIIANFSHVEGFDRKMLKRVKDFIAKSRFYDS